jgi:hypothetical protein
MSRYSLDKTAVLQIRKHTFTCHWNRSHDAQRTKSMVETYFKERRKNTSTSADLTHMAPRSMRNAAHPRSRRAYPPRLPRSQLNDRVARDCAKLQRAVRDRSDDAGPRGWHRAKDRHAAHDVSARGAIEHPGDGLGVRICKWRLRSYAVAETMLAIRAPTSHFGAGHCTSSRAHVG